MLKTPSEREKYWQKLEELEQKSVGVFACITPDKHKKRWEQKVLKLQAAIASAPTSEERSHLQKKLIELNETENKKAHTIAEFYSLYR